MPVGRSCTPTPSRPFRGSTCGVLTAAADLVAVSAHKFGGPKGVGALVVRHGTGCTPMIHGGGQERERRSGTHNVAGIVAMAAALAATVVRTGPASGPGGGPARPARRRASGLGGRSGRDRRRDHKVAGHLHLRFAGVDSEALVVLLDEAGVAVSAGAACSSGAVEASHVLTSMGLGAEPRRPAGSGSPWVRPPPRQRSTLPSRPSSGVVAQLRD